MAATLFDMSRPKGRREQAQAARNIATPKKDVKPPSPAWYVATMFALMAIGAIVIILNYLEVFPGGTRNWVLITGLLTIGGGFAMTLNYR